MLRDAAQRLPLLRRFTGRLVPTRRGRALAGDPVGVWWLLAGELPLSGRDASDAEWQAGVLFLALMATGSTDAAGVEVARLLTGLGWAVGDGARVCRRAGTGLIAAEVRLLLQLGAFDRDRHGGWPGTVTPEGIALARAALTTTPG